MIRIGSRGSQLARWQAEHIAARLHALGHATAIETITTTGDRVQNVSFLQVGTKGMFTKEIEEALSQGRIDLAVHSMKDLPTELLPEFRIAAVPERADARDAFVSVHYQTLQELPEGSVVGTSSMRRQAQVRALRPDLRVRELRGNVDTRLRKLVEGRYDAVLLAAAGLDRLQYTQYLRGRFAAGEICPAPAQGALAIECRSDDAETQNAVAALHHPRTDFAVTVERAVLARLGGGCHLPVGAFCGLQNAMHWKVTAVVARPDGSAVLREERSAPVTDASKDAARVLGNTIAERLLEQGAEEMLAAAMAAVASSVEEEA
ncbi:MAG: hydroxymethylbilane synthase [Acidobacteriaceae bacterium]